MNYETRFYSMRHWYKVLFHCGHPDDSKAKLNEQFSCSSPHFPHPRIFHFVFHLSLSFRFLLRSRVIRCRVCMACKHEDRIRRCFPRRTHSISKALRRATREKKRAHPYVADAVTKKQQARKFVLVREKKSTSTRKRVAEYTTMVWAKKFDEKVDWPFRNEGKRKKCVIVP